MECVKICASSENAKIPSHLLHFGTKKMEKYLSERNLVVNECCKKGKVHPWSEFDFS